MSTDDDLRSGTKKTAQAAGATQAEAGDLADHVSALRAELQSLTSTVGNMANRQVNRAQDKALETAYEAEEAIRRNPFQAVAIAAGMGFLFGIFTRR